MLWPKFLGIHSETPDNWVDTICNWNQIFLVFADRKTGTKKKTEMTFPILFFECEIQAEKNKQIRFYLGSAIPKQTSDYRDSKPI